MPGFRRMYRSSVVIRSPDDHHDGGQREAVGEQNQELAVR